MSKHQVIYLTLFIVVSASALPRYGPDLASFLVRRTSSNPGSPTSSRGGSRFAPSAALRRQATYALPRGYRSNRPVRRPVPLSSPNKGAEYNQIGYGDKYDYVFAYLPEQPYTDSQVAPDLKSFHPPSSTVIDDSTFDEDDEADDFQSIFPSSSSRRNSESSEQRSSFNDDEDEDSSVRDNSQNGGTGLKGLFNSLLDQFSKGNLRIPGIFEPPVVVNEDAEKEDTLVDDEETDSTNQGLAVIKPAVRARKDGGRVPSEGISEAVRDTNSNKSSTSARNSVVTSITHALDSVKKAAQEMVTNKKKTNLGPRLDSQILGDSTNSDSPPLQSSFANLMRALVEVVNGGSTGSTDSAGGQNFITSSKPDPGAIVTAREENPARQFINNAFGILQEFNEFVTDTATSAKTAVKSINSPQSGDSTVQVSRRGGVPSVRPVGSKLLHSPGLTAALANDRIDTNPIEQLFTNVLNGIQQVDRFVLNQQDVLDTDLENDDTDIESKKRSDVISGKVDTFLERVVKASSKVSEIIEDINNQRLQGGGTIGASKVTQQRRASPRDQERNNAVVASLLGAPRPLPTSFSVSATTQSQGNSGNTPAHKVGGFFEDVTRVVDSVSKFVQNANKPVRNIGTFVNKRAPQVLTEFQESFNPDIIRPDRLFGLDEEFSGSSDQVIEVTGNQIGSAGDNTNRDLVLETQLAVKSANLEKKSPPQKKDNRGARLSRTDSMLEMMKNMESGSRSAEKTKSQMMSVINTGMDKSNDEAEPQPMGSQEREVLLETIEEMSGRPASGVSFEKVMADPRPQIVEVTKVEKILNPQINPALDEKDSADAGDNEDESAEFLNISSFHNLVGTLGDMFSQELGQREGPPLDSQRLDIK